MAAATGDITRREMFAEIKKLCAPNNYTNIFVLVREYAVFACVVAATMFAYQWIVGNGWSRWWTVPIYLVSMGVIGVWVQNRLACLVHESSHYSLFKNRVVNDLMANLFIAFQFYAVISNYRIGHWGHHRHVNEPEKDPDLLRLVQHHPREFPVPKWRVFFEYVLLQLMPHKALSYLKGRAEYVAFTMKHEPVKNQDPLGKRILWALRIAYYGILFGVLIYFGWITHYLLFWIVPFLTVYPATLFLREIGHHGNYPDNGDFTNSRVYEGFWLEREIFFPFSEQNHVIHHMFPTVPWHTMRQAHDVMMRYPPYRENVIICDGFFFKADPASGNPSVVDLITSPSSDQLRNNGRYDLPGNIREHTAEEVGAVEIAASEYHRGES